MVGVKERERGGEGVENENRSGMLVVEVGIQEEVV